ncbi:hypothetical protein LR48_Vigan01g061800 [Vigna angularis]|uniref:Uncharacterized protein n=1 Tax=Phaseolus angularis TaxID=3914 RepID=A0A0L9TKE4_PHAAN|nr:hypothetical protein LR48_Vigan01g061800 [Vigna angularis]
MKARRSNIPITLTRTVGKGENQYSSKSFDLSTRVSIRPFGLRCSAIRSQVLSHMASTARPFSLTGTWSFDLTSIRPYKYSVTRPHKCSAIRPHKCSVTLSGEGSLR